MPRINAEVPQMLAALQEEQTETHLSWSNFERLLGRYATYYKQEDIAQAYQHTNRLLANQMLQPEFSSECFGAIFEGLSLLPLLKYVEGLNESRDKHKRPYYVASPTDLFMQYLLFVSTFEGEVRELPRIGTVPIGITAHFPRWSAFGGVYNSVERHLPLADYIIMQGDSVVSLVEASATNCRRELINMPYDDLLRKRQEGSLYYVRKVHGAYLLWLNSQIARNKQKEVPTWYSLRNIIFVGEKRGLPSAEEFESLSHAKFRTALYEYAHLRGRVPLGIDLIDFPFSKVGIGSLADEICQ